MPRSDAAPTPASRRERRLGGVTTTSRANLTGGRDGGETYLSASGTLLHCSGARPLADATGPERVAALQAQLERHGDAPARARDASELTVHRVAEAVGGGV